MNTIQGLCMMFGDEMLAQIEETAEKIVKEAYRKRRDLGDCPRSGYAVTLVPGGPHAGTALQMLVDRSLLHYAPNQDYTDRDRVGTQFFVSEELMAMGKAIEETE